MKKHKKLSWVERIKIKKTEATSYALTKNFNLGEYIAHDKFGVGHIENILGNKIEVLFEDKTRILMQTIAG